MVGMIKKLKILLDKKQKETIVLLIFMMLIGAMLETLGVTLIIPVMKVLLDPSTILDNEYGRLIFDSLNFTSERTFIIAVSGLLIAVFIIKNAYLYLQQKLLYRFIYTNQFRTSERMMKNYMRRPYEFFLNADTAVIQRSITSDVNNMYALLLALMTLCSELIVAFFLSAVLLFVEPFMTILLGVVLLVTMGIMKSVLKPVMKKAGEDNQNYYSSLFKQISEAVAGIKEIKTGGREKHFTDEYIKCGKGYVDAVQKYTLYNNIPRLVIETVCVVIMVAYLTNLILSGRDTTQMLAILAAFGMAVVRLMPSANRINNQLNNIAYFEPFLMGVSDNLQDDIDDTSTDMSDLAPLSEKLPVNKSVELKGITYHYPGSDVLIFDDAELSIPVGKSVGIVGASGAGKSTIVDVLLGMLTLQSGSIKADGVDVLAKENYRKWIANIGYIPQTIFMLDDYIRDNVACGKPKDEVSEERIWEVLKEAKLDDFVRELPEGLDTGIGERGVRLSGGQRQRIGIARALYMDPEILILDEATSALDNDTEAAIMDSINAFMGKKTLVIIAHRLQTIEKCDMVYRVEEGKLKKER